MFITASLLVSTPHEIFTLIVGDLDQASLSRLSRCSHVCYETTLPFLYGSVTFVRQSCMLPLPYKDESRGPWEQEDERHFIPHLYEFTCQVLDDPRLASMVKTLKIHESKAGYESDTPRTSKNPINCSIERLINCVCKRRFSAHKDQLTWIAAIRDSPDSDPLLACLLPSLPNLECLEIGLLPRARYFTQMLRGIIRGNGIFPDTAFKRLKHVSSRPYGYRTDLPTSSLRSSSNYLRSFLLKQVLLEGTTVWGKTLSNLSTDFLYENSSQPRLLLLI